MSREDELRRVSALAGVDIEGNITPPPAGTTINRKASPMWKNGYADLLREKPQDNSAYVECMRQMRAAAIQAELAIGGPVRMEIEHHFDAGRQTYVVTARFFPIRSEPDPPQE